MLYLHLPLIQSALGQKVEAKPVVVHRERSQRWVAIHQWRSGQPPRRSRVALGPESQSNATSLPLSGEVVGLSAFMTTGRVVAYAVSGAPTILVLPAIMPSIQHGPLTDEVPRRLVLWGQVSPGYKSYTKGLGHASEAGRASPQPRPKGCQQRQSRSLWSRVTDDACSERQNLRVPPGPLGSMGLVSSATAATKWPGGTSSCQPAGLLSNSLAQPKLGQVAVRSR